MQLKNKEIIKVMHYMFLAEGYNHTKTKHFIIKITYRGQFIHNSFLLCVGGGGEGYTSCIDFTEQLS